MLLCNSALRWIFQNVCETERSLRSTKALITRKLNLTDFELADLKRAEIWLAEIELADKWTIRKQLEWAKSKGKLLLPTKVLFMVQYCMIYEYVVRMYKVQYIRLCTVHAYECYYCTSILPLDFADVLRFGCCCLAWDIELSEWTNCNFLKFLIDTICIKCVKHNLNANPC